MTAGPITPVGFVDEGLGNSCYLVDLGDGRALVVDPARHPAGYLADADRRHLEIAYAVETISMPTSCPAPASSASSVPTSSLLRRRATASESGGWPTAKRSTSAASRYGRCPHLATPGHTPEHLAYLLLDANRPIALFSGGSLLVGAIARTDLLSPAQTEPLARQLCRSLRERILVLADDLPVCPTHGAGSFCSAPANAERVTTIGREWATNPLLAAPDEDAFVTQLLGGLGTYPPYFLHLREVNRAGARLYGPGQPALARVAAMDVARLQRGGAWIVDPRPMTAFVARHLPGSVSIALRPQFATWLGWVLPADAAIVAVLDPDQDRADLVRQARNIGYEALPGELDGGIEAWTAAGYPVEQTATAPVARAGRRDLTVLIGGPDDWSAVHGPLATGP